MSGKQRDLSTPWSEWAWSEEHGCNYATRFDPDGNVEYDYMPRYTPVPEWDSQDNTGDADTPSNTTEQYTTSQSSNKYPNKKQVPVVEVLERRFKATTLDEHFDAIEGPGDQMIVAKKITRGGTTSNKDLDERYTVIDENEKKNKGFWELGRVFMMPWTEPARGSNETQGSQYSTVWLGQPVYTEIRRFVVIGKGWGNVICSPIHSYNGQATFKSNLPDIQQHAIIYTSRMSPGEFSYRESDNKLVQENLTKNPIRVHRELPDQEGDLGKLSRINYAKLYTVEKYVPILNIGKVHQDSMEALLASCFFARPENEPVRGPRKSKHSSNSREDRDSRDKGRSSKSSQTHKQDKRKSGK